MLYDIHPPADPSLPKILCQICVLSHKKLYPPLRLNLPYSKRSRPNDEENRLDRYGGKEIPMATGFQEIKDSMLLSK